MAFFALIVLANTYVSYLNYQAHQPPVSAVARSLEEAKVSRTDPHQRSLGLPINETIPSQSSLDILMKAVRDVHRPVPDAELDWKQEAARCERYGLTLREECSEGPNPACQRRRIFAGSLLADDSWHALGANALESYGIYEAVVFVESNRTISGQPRERRFYEGARDQQILQSGIYGPQTPVYIDPYIDEEGSQPNKGSLVRENMQRQVILERWKKLGMRPDDVGLIMDVDEISTHDYLRAVQICHVPIWDDHPATQNCFNPVLRSAAIFFEGAPQCIHRGRALEFRRWTSPSMVIGNCIEGIGDAARYPSAPRKFVDKKGVHHGARLKGFQPNGNEYGNYPLFNGADFRQVNTRNLFWGNRAFHLHNFYVSLEKLRFKHLTYGHLHENAFNVPLGALNADLNVLVKCVMERDDTGNRWQRLEHGLEKMKNNSYDLPIAFQLEGYNERRFEEVKKLIAVDEEEYGRADKFDGHHLYSESLMLTHKGRRQHNDFANK